MPSKRANQNVLVRFGQRLRQVRLSKGLTQEVLAAEAGFSRSYYTEIETGKRNISLQNIEKLARALDVEIKEFFDSDT